MGNPSEQAPIHKEWKSSHICQEQKRGHRRDTDRKSISFWRAEERMLPDPGVGIIKKMWTLGHIVEDDAGSYAVFAV